MTARQLAAARMQDLCRLGWAQIKAQPVCCAGSCMQHAESAPIAGQIGHAAVGHWGETAVGISRQQVCSPWDLPGETKSPLTEQSVHPVGREGPLTSQALHRLAPLLPQVGTSPCTTVRATMQPGSRAARIAGLLALPAGLLQQHVVPQLSCRSLGALLLTCKQLHAVVTGAELSSRLAEAGRTLSKGHPLFSTSQVGPFLAQQARTEAAVAARDSWAWQDLSAMSHAAFSPDGAKAAACYAHQLLLYDLTNPQLDAAPTVVPLAQRGSRRLPIPCTFSDDSDLVAWEASPRESRRTWLGPVHIYRLSTGELHSAVVETRNPGIRLPDACFTPWGDLLTFAGDGEGYFRLCTVTPCAGGTVAQKICPVMFSPRHADGSALAVSSSGSVIFTAEESGVVCLWQPGTQLRPASLLRTRHKAKSLALSPPGTTVLVARKHSVAFLDLQGVAQAKQDLELVQVPVWGHQGVLVGPCEWGADLTIRFFAVLPGPSLELQHTILLPSGCRLSSPLALSSDHFAFVVGDKGSTPWNNAPTLRQLTVLPTPKARPANSAIQVTTISQLPASTELGSAAHLGTVKWLDKASALVCLPKRSDYPGCLQPKLVRF